MKMYVGVEVQLHVFLTSVLVVGEWSASRPGRFTPGTHWIGSWVGPRAGLDYVDKRKFLTIPGLEFRPLGRPARSQSVYRLSSWFYVYYSLQSGSKETATETSTYISLHLNVGQSKAILEIRHWALGGLSIWVQTNRNCLPYEVRSFSSDQALGRCIRVRQHWTCSVVNLLPFHGYLLC
jgi:hypothetical protein